MAPFWRKNARCWRAHESRPTTIASASGTTRFHAPHGSSASPAAPRPRAIARAWTRVRRPRARAAGDGKEIEVVVARNDEEPPRACHRANAASTSSQPCPSSVQSPVMTTASTSLLGDGPRAAQSRRRFALCGVVSSICASAPSLGGAARQRTERAAPRGGTPWPPRARPDRAARRSRARSARGGAYPSGSTRTIVAPLAFGARAGRASCASSQHVSNRAALASATRAAPPDEARAVVQRVAERRDVEVRDVGEGERSRPRSSTPVRDARRASRPLHPGDDLERLAVTDEVEPVVGDLVVPLVPLHAGELPRGRVRVVDVDVVRLRERDAPVADLVTDARWCGESRPSGTRGSCRSPRRPRCFVLPPSSK